MKKILKTVLFTVPFFILSGCGEAGISTESKNSTFANQQRSDNQKAANQGDALAQFNMGVMYYEGQGVNKNYVLARQWYEKAANQGRAAAQAALGWMYFQGEGVIRDREKGCALWRMSADERADYLYKSNCNP